MINFKNKDLSLIQQAIADAGHILTSDGNGNLIISDAVAIQAIIDALPDPMPELSPRQFNYLLAVTGLVPLIDESLIILQGNNLAMFADAYSQLKGGMKFFWDISFDMFQRFYPMFDMVHHQMHGVDAPFTLDEASLRSVWWLASAY